MLACSSSMREILINHLIDVQSNQTGRKKWHFYGPWEIYG